MTPYCCVDGFPPVELLGGYPGPLASTSEGSVVSGGWGSQEEKTAAVWDGVVVL